LRGRAAARKIGEGTKGEGTDWFHPGNPRADGNGERQKGYGGREKKSFCWSFFYVFLIRTRKKGGGDNRGGRKGKKVNPFSIMGKDGDGQRTKKEEKNFRITIVSKSMVFGRRRRFKPQRRGENVPTLFAILIASWGKREKGKPRGEERGCVGVLYMIRVALIHTHHTPPPPPPQPPTPSFISL